MRLESAKAIADAAAELGLDARVQENYSGRGMYGKMTAAVVTDSPSDLYQIVAEAAIRVYETENEYQGRLNQEEAEEPLSRDDFVADLRLRQDNMGRGIVVY